MVQHRPQRALSFPTLPSARTLLELENVLFSWLSRRILGEPRGGFCRNRLIDVNLQHKQTNKQQTNKKALAGELLPLWLEIWQVLRRQVKVEGTWLLS